MKTKNISKVFLSFIVILYLQIANAGELINITTVGKDELQLPNLTSISIINFDKIEENGHLQWKSKLVLKNGNQIVSQKYPIMTDYDENYFYYFVPVKRDQFIFDLNYDGKLEFAVAVDHGGNAPYTTVFVFSLIDDQIQFYKKAWFQMDGGQEIMWKKPK